MDKCIYGPKNENVWLTVKPFPRNKGCSDGNGIILYKNSKLVNVQYEISDIFNKYYVILSTN